MMETIRLSPIGIVRNECRTILNDHWHDLVSVIELLPVLQEDALNGLETFSHAEILFFFDRVPEEDIETGSRHPRNNPNWPRVGVLSQRGKDRPNRLGATIVRILGHTSRTLTVQGLDALDGTPVIDIKPVMREFLPKGEVQQPSWVQELMKDYWDNEQNASRLEKK